MKIWKWSLLVASLLCATGVGLAQQPADTILHNGKILTIDRSSTVAEAVAVRSGRIAAVGSNAAVLALAGPNTVRIDLKGRTVAPGLINTHLHIEAQHLDGGDSYAREIPTARLRRYALNFRTVKTKDDVVRQIRDIITAFKFKPGEWLFFPTNPRGPAHAKILFNELNRWELDKAAPNNPIALSLGIPVVNGMLINSKGVEALWGKHGKFIETYGRFWIDSNGRPTGHVEPPAVRILMEDADFLPAPSPEDAASVYRRILEEYSAMGLTTISGALHTTTLRAYQWLDSRGEMPLRYAYGVMSTFGIPGADVTPFKMGEGTDPGFISSISARAVDGSGSRMCVSVQRNPDAVKAVETEEPGMTALSASLEWWPRGQCSLDIEYNGGSRGARISGNYFMEFYDQLAAAGLRTANVHVAGDDSHSRLITAYERLDAARPGSVKNWGMDHCRMVDPKDIPRAARLGLMWSCPAPGVGGAPEMAAAFGERVVHTHHVPIKSMVDAGVNVSLEGEGGGNVWRAIELVVTRKDDKGKVWGPQERVDRMTALRIATQGGANYVLKGDRIGSIETGKFADLIVLDRDYASIPEDQISDVRTLATMMGGRFIFLHRDFSAEHSLKPAGAVISTFEDLRKRRPAGGAGGSEE